MLGNLVSGSRDMGYLTPVRSPGRLGRFPSGGVGGIFLLEMHRKKPLKTSMAPVGLDGCGSFSFLFHQVFFSYF